MIYVTHDQIEAMSMGDRIVVMKSGIVQQVDTPLTIYNKPANRFVASFIGSPTMNFFGGRLTPANGLTFESTEKFLQVPLQPADAARLASHSGAEITLGIRPEHVM